MTGPTFRHWLTGFVFAALVHLILAAILMGFWREAPPEAGSAERPGLEVTLFPGFQQAVGRVSPDAPPAPEREPPPVDTALESAPPIPLLAPDRSPNEVLPVTAEPVATAVSPTPVAAEPAMRQPPTERESGLETVALAEIVEAVPASEVSALAVPAPVAPDRVPDAVEIPDARLDLAAEPAQALEPSALSPTEAPLEPVVVSEPEAMIGTLPPEPLLAAAATPAETIAVVASETAAFADLAPVVATEETPAAVVMAAPTAETPTAPIFVVPDPVETVTADPVPTSPEPVIATEAPEVAPLAAPDTREITEAAEVASVDMPAEALPVESVAVEIAQITGIRPTPAESIAIAETIETVESIAVLPEAEAEARETPLPPAATEPSGPKEEEEDTGTQDPPSAQIAQDAPQLPGIQDQYFRTLRDWLDRHKDYPRLAQRRGEEGTVVLAFTLNRYGMVLEHAIVRSSGHTMLDNTVEHLIRRAQPLPAMPPEMNVELLQVIVPIEFRLER